MQTDLTYGSSHVEGLRIFYLDYKTLELGSIASTRTKWPAGEIMHSTCSRAPAHGHLKPEPRCMCGFWSYKSRWLLEHGDVARGHVLNKRPLKQYWSDELQIVQLGSPGIGKTMFMNRLVFNALNAQQHGIAFVEETKTYAQQPTIFSARIEQWGTVIEHTQGYRSEFARIIPHTIQAFPRHESHRKHKKIVQFLREKYSDA